MSTNLRVRLIVLSTAFRDVLSNDYGIPTERICIVPGGVEIQRFRPSDKLAARRQFGWPEDACIILCVRRLVPTNGPGQSY